MVEARLPAVQVPRRLIDWLDAGMESPIQVVRAGAGWGKTTLLRQWLNERQEGRRVGLIAIHPGTDATDLAQELLSRWHGGRTSLPLALGQSDVDRRAAARLGLAAARAISPAGTVDLLVFDDVQAVTTASGMEFLTALLTRLPDRCHVVLAGRRLPSEFETRLGLAFVPTLEATELRLTLDETMTVISTLLQPAPSPESVRALHARTEGWPGGIIAAVRAAGEHGGSLALETHRLHEVLGGYFESEVLSELSPEGRRLLLETSVVGDDLTPALARDLTGYDSTRALLGALDASGGFLSVSGRAERHYHLMPLLVEHLQQSLAQSRPARGRLMHRRAAVSYAKQGAISSACEHAIAAGDVPQALRLAGQHWLRYARRGHEAIVQSWLDAIERASTTEDVTVAFIRGWFGGMRGVRSELDRSIAVLSAHGEDAITGGPATGRSGLAMLRAAFVSRGGSDGVAEAREGVEALAAGSVWWTIGQCLLGYHLYWSGEYDEARRVLVTATESASVNQVPVAVLQMALGILGVIDAFRRYAPGARRNARRALDLAASAGLSGTPQTVPALVAHALSDATTGYLDNAALELERSARDAQRDATGRYLALTYLATSYVRQLMGDRAAAEASLQSAQRLIDDLPEARVLEVEAQLASRKLRLRPRRVPVQPDEPTRREARVLELLAAGLTRAEIADELGVSQDTIKTHVRNLYMKLEADSRNAALERARTLGFLRPENGGSHPVRPPEPRFTETDVRAG